MGSLPVYVFVYVCARSINQINLATRYNGIHFPLCTTANLQLTLCYCEKARFLAKDERATAAVIYPDGPDWRKWPAGSMEGQSQIGMFWNELNEMNVDRPLITTRRLQLQLFRYFLPVNPSSTIFGGNSTWKCCWYACLGISQNVFWGLGMNTV